MRGNELEKNTPCGNLVADYLGQGCATYGDACPRRIIIGGGVMERHSLYQRVRERTAHYLNGYIQVREILHDIDHPSYRPGSVTDPVLGAFVGRADAQAAGTA